MLINKSNFQNLEIQKFPRRLFWGHIKLLICIFWILNSKYQNMKFDGHLKSIQMQMTNWNGALSSQQESFVLSIVYSFVENILEKKYLRWQSGHDHPWYPSSHCSHLAPTMWGLHVQVPAWSSQDLPKDPLSLHLQSVKICKT